MLQSGFARSYLSGAGTRLAGVRVTNDSLHLSAMNTRHSERTAGVPEPTARPATTLAPLRAMQVIAELARSREGLTLAQLSTQLAVPKSSLFSLLRTLDSGGYVDSSAGLYRLGQEAFALGALVTGSRPFPDNLRPLLSRLHHQCGETVLIAVPSDNWTEVVYVDLIESENSLRFKVAVGSRDPIYCTALGLAMLAFAPPDVQQRYVERIQLKRVTDGTITSKAELIRVLAQVKSRALAISSGINENVTAISAPVFDAGGQVVAGVALAGLTVNVMRREAKLSEVVRRTGAAMSRTLGYAPPYLPSAS